MVFIFLLIAITLTIAGSAAFFSVYGLAQIFSGSFWPVVAMATSLEAGKLIAASYVYRYWDKISFWMKGYLLSALFVLMIITSAGIFGFLSGAYQKDVLPMKLKEQQIELLEKEKTEIEKMKTERLERKQQIDEQIANLPSNYVKGRQSLIQGFKDETQQLNKDVVEYSNLIREKTLKISELKNEKLQQDVHIGPIVYIATILNDSVDQATKYLILLIIFAFDPLAVILTVGANIALIEHKKEKRKKVALLEEIKQEVNDIKNEEKEIKHETEEINVHQQTIFDTLEEINLKSESLKEGQKELLDQIQKKREITDQIRQGI